jgi:hypothetical protein
VSERECQKGEQRSALEALWALGALEPKKWLKRPDARVALQGFVGQGLAAACQMSKLARRTLPRRTAALRLARPYHPWNALQARNLSQSFENPTSSLMPESMLSMSCLLLFSYMPSYFLADPYVSAVK